MIRFGSMSIVLLLGALYALMRAAMLWWSPQNRNANRMLATLLAAISLFLFPYIVGYAGYYDAYPWLSYFPYNLSLSFGPLLYCYVAGFLQGGALPARWGWHLLPALVQFIYYCVLFAQPLAFKNDWDARVHVPYIDTAETILVSVSMTFYWLLSFRRFKRAAALGDPRLEWMRNVLIGLSMTIVLWGVLALAETIWSGLTYFQRFPFYLWLVVLVSYLGTEGYRHGKVAYPDPAPDKRAPAPTEPAAPPPTLAELGEGWRKTIIERQLWRDPELSVASLARALGTNATILSRAFNDGLGVNFNELINRIRVDAVVVALQAANDGKPVLDIALEEGFNSKASFNRAFKQYTGKTPTEYRRAPPANGDVSISA